MIVPTPENLQIHMAGKSPYVKLSADVAWLINLR
jgi:hypothetical protein